MRIDPRVLSEAERRDVLLSAAEHVFVGKGYVSTTMADIAQAAGMSKKTIYQVFDSKKALFDALMMDRLAVPKMSAEDADQPPAVVLRAVLLEMSRYVLSPKQIALTRLILAEIASTPEVGDVLKARCVQVETMMQSWLGLQASRGVFDIPDIPGAAALLFGIAFGDFHWHLLLQLGETPSEAMVMARIERSVAIFMREFARVQSDRSSSAAIPKFAPVGAPVERLAESGRQSGSARPAKPAD